LEGTLANSKKQSEKNLAVKSKQFIKNDDFLLKEDQLQTPQDRILDLHKKGWQQSRDPQPKVKAFPSGMMPGLCSNGNRSTALPYSFCNRSTRSKPILHQGQR
jgi:hypothetical protein